MSNTHQARTFGIKMPKQFLGWQQIFGETHTRIFFWYLLILVITFLVAIPTFRYKLYRRVDERVQDDLVEDMKAFRELMNIEKRAPEYAIADEANEEDEQKKLQSSESKPLVSTSKKFTPVRSKQDLMQLFATYLLYRLPEDESYFITFIDGKFYKSSPRARPQQLAQNSKLMRMWARQTQSMYGEETSPAPKIEKIFYMLEPIKINGQTRGVFVVAHSAAGEREEALEAISVIIEVSIFVFVVSLMLAWLAAGQVLTPLQAIIGTAHTISETDLTQRLPVRGHGELAELATTFNEMMNRLEAAFATQRDFLNDAGHELRTPITIIRGHLELMGDDPQEQQETLALVMGELDRITRMVDDMILLAKAERWDFLQLATVNVADLTKEVLAKSQALAERNWRLDSVAKGQIVVDRQRITEAIINLAENATKYTTNTDTISIGSAISKEHVRFWVRDTGEGIALVEQKRIFERFARASTSRHRSDGSGLGLAIVRAIAEAHGGRVLLRSKLGKGSKFTLVLPLDPPQEKSAYAQHSHC